MTAATVLFDADCGFCQWTVAKILAWDRKGRVRALALQDPEAQRMLPADMHETVRMASWHVVMGDGRVHSAGRALAPLLRLLPGGAPLAAACNAFPGITESAYRFVAQHRGKLGRGLRQRSCRSAHRRP